MSLVGDPGRLANVFKPGSMGVLDGLSMGLGYGLNDVYDDADDDGGGEGDICNSALRTSLGTECFRRVGKPV